MRAPGRSAPLGATVVDGGVNFSLFSRDATGVELLLFDREDDAEAFARDRPRSRREPNLPLLARLRAGRAARADLRLPRLRPVRPGQRAALRSRRRSCSTRTAATWSSPTATAARPPAAQGDNAATAMKSVVVDPAAYDWEGDAPLQPAVLAHDHLRDARARLHAPPELRRGREDARHLCRADREDPLPPGLGITAVELLPVFQFDAQECPPGWSTTGATSRCRSSRRTRRTARGRSRSARWTSSATWSRPCTARASK